MKDINDDGYDDIIISSSSGGVDHFGVAYVLWGKSVKLTGYVTLSTMTKEQGLIVSNLNGIQNGDTFGKSVAVGDVDGDGAIELIVAQTYLRTSDASLGICGGLRVIKRGNLLIYILCYVQNARHIL